MTLRLQRPRVAIALATELLLVLAPVHAPPRAAAMFYVNPPRRRQRRVRAHARPLARQPRDRAAPTPPARRLMRCPAIGTSTATAMPPATSARWNGDDRLFGAAGNDELLGEMGRDALKGGPGTDSCYDGAGADAMAAAHGCEAATGVL